MLLISCFFDLFLNSTHESSRLGLSQHCSQVYPLSMFPKQARGHCWWEKLFTGGALPPSGGGKWDLDSALVGSNRQYVWLDFSLQPLPAIGKEASFSGEPVEYEWAEKSTM